MDLYSQVAHRGYDEYLPVSDLQTYYQAETSTPKTNKNEGFSGQ